MYRSALTLAMALAAPAVHAQSVPRAEERLNARAADIVAAKQGTRPREEVFTEGFNTAISAEQFAALAAQLSQAHGKLTGAEDVKAAAGGAATFKLRYERALASGSFQLEPDAPHKVAGFRITSVAPLDDGPQKIADDFAALAGSAGFGLYRLGAEGPELVQGHRPDAQFAIGSAFKLWVLDALAEEIDGGRLKWDQVVRLGTRSLPSGQMQDWPEGASVTVETLATQMIAISDNTATDTLIRLVGREKLAARVRATGHADPDRMLPFLTTLEAFALKSGDPAQRASYAATGEAQQAAILAALGRGLTPAAVDGRRLAGDKPNAIDTIEWFASAADLARVMDSLRRRADPRLRAILAVRPGLVGEQRAAFAYAGFKGGSEPGVINLTWLLRSKAGDWYVAAGSWNNTEAPVDNRRFEQLVQRVVGLAK